MLIWLDRSVLEADLSNDAKSCDGLIDVFNSYKRGQHYVLADRATLEAIKDSSELPKVTCATALKILANLSTQGGLKQLVSKRIEVTYGKSKTTKRLSEQSWEVPLLEISKNGIKKSALLAENLDDAKAFEHAARQYLATTGLGGHVALERAHGGGSSTPSVFNNMIHAEARWCLCITDSDRVCPAEQMELTAKKCQTLADNTNFVAGHIHLDVREIENLLPLAFLDGAIPPTHQYKWDWHKNQLLALKPDAHYYCDIKNGNTRKAIYALQDGVARKTYWLEIIKCLTESHAIPSSPCDEDKRCSQESGDCKCVVVWGYGEGVLSTVLSNLECLSPHESEKAIRKDFNCNNWLAIGRSVYDWCCAPKQHFV
jgi:hypothetical protein